MELTLDKQLFIILLTMNFALVIWVIIEIIKMELLSKRFSEATHEHIRKLYRLYLKTKK